MKHMTAIAITSPGGPEVLRPVELPVPVPRPGEILVRVKAAGVNRPDVLQRQGAYPPPPGAPETPGLEIAGEVAALGEGARRYEVGDRVFDRGRLKEGETLLVHGGSSGIGTTAIMLGKAFGAVVAVTAGTEEKCSACRALGADLAINYRAADFAAVLAEKGIRPDVILDMVGGEYVAKNLKVAAMHGRIVMIAFQKGSRFEADWMPIMLKRLTFTGSTLRPRSVAEKAEIARALERQVWPLFGAEQLKPIIFRTFPLAEAAAAHALMESSEHIGKIVLLT